MKMPSLSSIVLFVLIIIAFFVWRADARSDEADRIEYQRLVDVSDEIAIQNDSLRRERIEFNEIAVDSFAVLEVVIRDAEREITVIAAAGRQTFVEIIEAIPDSMPELRAQIELREQQHDEEIAQKDTVIAAERSASSVLRGQLARSDGLLVGIEDELVAANDQIVFLEGLRNDGLSNLESAAFGLGAYIIATEALNASTIEGTTVGGTTYLVMRGGSKLLSWIF